MGCCCPCLRRQKRNDEEELPLRGHEHEPTDRAPPPQDDQPTVIYGRDKYRFQESPEIEALFSERDLPPQAQAIHRSYRKIKQRCLVLRESLEALASQLRFSGDTDIEISTSLATLRQAAGPEADIQLVYECDVPRIVIKGAEKHGSTEERLLAHRPLNTLLTNSYEIVQDTYQVVAEINDNLKSLLHDISTQKDTKLYERLCLVPSWVYSVSTQANQLLNDIKAAEPYLRPQVATD